MQEPKGGLLKEADMHLFLDIDGAAVLARNKLPVRWCPVHLGLCVEVSAAHWLKLAYAVAGHSLQPTRATIMMPQSVQISLTDLQW